MGESSPLVFMETPTKGVVAYYPIGCDPEDETTTMEFSFERFLYPELDEEEPIYHVPGTGFLKAMATCTTGITRFVLIPLKDCIPDFEALQNGCLRYVYIGEDPAITSRFRDEATNLSENDTSQRRLPPDKSKRHKNDRFRGHLRVALRGWETDIMGRLKSLKPPPTKKKKRRRKR